MGIFSSILDKIRSHRRADTSDRDTSQTQASGQTTQTQASPANAQRSTPTQASASQPVLQNVDVDAVLADLARGKGGGGNYRQSIVDLLKLLDLDSSLAARKALAEELNVFAGAHGSAEQNIALHRAVTKKLEENGGKVPESMRS